MVAKTLGPITPSMLQSSHATFTRLSQWLQHLQKNASARRPPTLSPDSRIRSNRQGLSSISLVQLANKNRMYCVHTMGGMNFVTLSIHSDLIIICYPETKASSELTQFPLTFQTFSGGWFVETIPLFFQGLFDPRPHGSASRRNWGHFSVQRIEAPQG